MRAKAFSPAHITGFFKAELEEKDPNQLGSLGAGFSIKKGVTTIVNVRTKTKHDINSYGIQVKGFNTGDIRVSEHVLNGFLVDGNRIPTMENYKLENSFDSSAKQLEFIKTFRELMRLRNILTGFSDFNHHDLSMGEQQFEDYKSKYLDLYERVKHNKENQIESILDEVDFEIELIRTDEINVAYILRLLAKYRESSIVQQEKMKRNIMSIIDGQEQLRSKRELIEAFIDKNLMAIVDTEDIDDEFENYWEQQKSDEFESLCAEENLNIDEVRAVVETYLYEQRKPLNDDISKTLVDTYKFIERRTVISRVLEKIMQHIEKFYEL